MCLTYWWRLLGVAISSPAAGCSLRNRTRWCTVGGPDSGWRRRMPVCLGRHLTLKGGASRPWPSAWECLLCTRVLLISSHSVCPSLEQRVLYGPGCIERKDGPFVDRVGNRSLPCLEHLLHLASHGVVERGVRLHEGGEELAAEVERVWRADVLDDGVEQVQGRQLPGRGDLVLNLSVSHVFMSSASEEAASSSRASIKMRHKV
jgi:hypothetical protein